MSRSERGRDIAPAPSRPGRMWRRTALGLNQAEQRIPALDNLTSAGGGADEYASSAPSAASTAPDDESFAARLRYLFAATRQASGRPWSANAVARASGGRLTAQAVYSLYRGSTPNPKLETIRALAEIFGIDPEYFVSPGALGRLKAKHTGQYAELVADPGIAFVSRQMGQMSPEDKAIIVAMVQRLTGEPSQKDMTAIEPLDATVITQMRQDLP